jgi:hypothetical protein
MEDIQTLDDNFIPELTLTSQIRGNLKEAAKWSKFLAIVIFVNIGLMALGVFTMLFGVGFFASDIGMAAGFFSAYAFFMFLMIVFVTIPTLFLYRFANNMQVALQREDQNRLFESFANLKSYCKFWGVLTAIFLGFYALLFVGTLLFGGFGALFGGY